MVRVTDGNSQGIGDIMRLWRLGEIEQEGDHALYLLLLGAAISDGRALDLQRRIFVDGRSSPRG